MACELGPWLGEQVLEVGAGIGATTRALLDEGRKRWTALEPDAEMAATLARDRESGDLPDAVEVREGDLSTLLAETAGADLPPESAYDSVLYSDVLEHVENDEEELRRAGRCLKPGGRIVVLSPAHQWLFSPFDAAIGHHRRYSRDSLRRAAPAGFPCERLVYLDSAGLLASLANKLFLRQAQPSLAQVRSWDGLLVPISRWLDPLTLGLLGKSVLGVFRKPSG
jgi:SAM-dependent methyltransferase